MRRALEETKARPHNADSVAMPLGAESGAVVTQKLRAPRLPKYTGGVGSMDGDQVATALGGRQAKPTPSPAPTHLPSVIPGLGSTVPAQSPGGVPKPVKSDAAQEDDGARDVFGFGAGDEVPMAPVPGPVGQGTRFLRPDTGHNAEWHRRHGNAALAAGDWAAAATEYSVAISLAPHRAIFYANRAAAWLHGGQWLDAAADACTALDADESLVRALVYRGDAYAGLGEYEAASHDYTAALHVPLVPEASRTHCLLRLGLCLWRSEARCVARIQELSTRVGVDLEEAGGFARAQMALLRRAIDVHVAIAQTGTVRAEGDDGSESVFSPPSRQQRLTPSVLPDMDPDSAISQLHLARRVGIDLENVLREVELYEQLFMDEGATGRLATSVRCGIMAAAEASLAQRVF